MRPELPSGTVTFLFTDVEGSTRLLHELGAERYAEALAEHRRIVREACAAHHGVEVDTQGDAFFVAFPTAPGALAAARAITERLAESLIRLRMGLHTGTPLVTDEGYVGADVHRAARIAAAGHGGQVLVSASTSMLLEVELRDLGEHRFKDLAAAERVYQLGGGDFPALKSLYRTNLPVPATTFLGREQELREVIDLLTRDEVRVLTLTGPGGTGKTRLALQASAEASDHYPDGLFWVPLAPLRDPTLLLSAVAQALDVTEDPDTDLAETLKTAIAGKEALVVLDNLEHLLPHAASELAQLASAAGPTLLVTSRERLQLQGEQLYPVPTLDRSDAVALFLARARALVPEFRGNGALPELCLRLDNLPLALELAAARTTLFSAEQLLERLSQRLDLLKGARDADPRQRTLRATIEWSYELLDQEEQRLLRSLSVFAGGSTYEAAEEVCGADPDTLQSLLDKSLLRRLDTNLGPRYWMLETIGGFAAERLEVAGEQDPVRRRHAEFQADLVDASEREITGVEQERWWRRLTDEEENIRAALGWSCDGGDPALALRLSGALWRYWWQRCRFREESRWYEAALSLDTGESEVLRAQARYGAANMALGSGDYPSATRLLTECLPVFRKAGDENRTMSVLIDLGIASFNAGRLEESRSHYEAALELALETGDTRVAGIVYGNLAEYFRERGDLDRAAEHLARAVSAVRDARDDQAEATFAASLAFIEFRRGRVDKAAELLRASVTLSQVTSDTRAIAHDLVIAAAIVVAKGHVRAAASLLAGASGLQEGTSLILDAGERRLQDETLAEIRTALDASEFDKAWASGRAMTPEEAVEYALEELRDA